MLPDSLLSLWVQIPLASILVFLVLKFLEHLKTLHIESNKTIVQLNTDNKTVIKDMHIDTLNFIANQSETNREFLKTQREFMNASLSRLAEEIKESRAEHLKEIAELTAMVDNILERNAK